MPPVTPTKGNLMAVKRSLTLAEMGYDLMDQKRNILVRELMGLIDRATDIQSRIDMTFRAAYASLQMANIALGICAELAASTPVDDSVVIRARSVMGVEIPLVTAGGEAPLTYGLSETDTAYDDAYVNFNKVKQLIRELSEVETSVYRLAVAVKKTARRVGALENIILPDLTATVARITEALEEKEREEFVRLKVIKRS